LETFQQKNNLTEGMKQKKKNKKINKNPNKYEKKKYLELKIPAEFYLIFLKNYNKAQKIKIKENKGT
jgi:hypothetical protein